MCANRMLSFFTCLKDLLPTLEFYAQMLQHSHRARNEKVLFRLQLLLTVPVSFYVTKISLELEKAILVGYCSPAETSSTFK